MTPPGLENTLASLPSQKTMSPPFFLKSTPSLFPPGTGTLRHPILPSAAALPPRPGHTVQRAQKDQGAQGTQGTRYFKWVLQESLSPSHHFQSKAHNRQPALAQATTHAPAAQGRKTSKALQMSGVLPKPCNNQQILSLTICSLFPQKKSSLTASRGFPLAKDIP